MPRTNKFKPQLYCCGDCNYGTNKGAFDYAIIDHIRGKHRVDVVNGCSHSTYCNDCPRTNGHGRRLPCMESVIDHLSDRHNIDIHVFNERTW